MDTLQPQMIVVGGPNGAGKTTFVRETQTRFGYQYLGADQIAADICPTAPESVAFEAGRQFMIQIESIIAAREHFIVESTLSGKSFRNSYHAASDAGYVLDTTFIFVNSASKSVARVAERVRVGGHDVPAADVRRRFQRCLTNFWDIYRPLSDRWSLIYNQIERVDVAEGFVDNEIVYDRSLYDFFHQLRVQSNDDR